MLINAIDEFAQYWSSLFVELIGYVRRMDVERYNEDMVRREEMVDFAKLIQGISQKREMLMTKQIYQSSKRNYSHKFME